MHLKGNSRLGEEEKWKNGWLQIGEGDLVCTAWELADSYQGKDAIIVT